MESLSGNWIGNISGTNNGDVYVKILDNSGLLSGEFKINDRSLGTSVYKFTGKRSGNNVEFSLQPNANNISNRTYTARVNGRTIEVEAPPMYGSGSAIGKIIKENVIEGTWETQIGTGGLFTIAHSEAINYREPTHDNTVFVLMGISNEAHNVDTLDVIRRSAESFALKAERVDEIMHSGKISDLILQKISNSRMLVCDISTERPNVYYELGYAHGKSKDVIIIAKRGSPLHFDIQDYNIILFTTYSELGSALKARMAEYINNATK